MNTKAPRKAASDLESPRDKFRIIYMLFFLLGLVHFLPYAFFTTATQYWMYKFRNTTIESTNSEFRSELQAQFHATLKVVRQVPDIIFLVLTFLFGHHLKTRVRLLGVLSIITILFAVVTLFVKINTDSWQGGFFGMIMAIAAGINAMNAVFTITMYSVLAHFPHVYLTAYLLGGGLSGIFTGSFQIISLSLGLSTQDSALVYFSVGLFVLLFSLFSLIVTDRNQFYVYHMSIEKEVDKNHDVVTFRKGLRLLRKIWSSVLMTGLYLLTVDASVAALVVSEGEGNGVWNDVYFIPTITYLSSSITGLMGRATSFVLVPKLSSTTWSLFAFVRFLIFTPLFMLCNAQPRHHLPVLLPHDYQYIIINSVDHFTGSYLLSRTSYNIASLVEPEELKKAYNVNMLCAGLWMGALSWVSIVFVKLL